MKRLFYAFLVATTVSFVAISCNTQQDSSETDKIENTIQSVTYFKDTTGIDPLELKAALNSMNEAIDEIGYPDAGYKLWTNQSEESEIRFMVEGFWPDQEAYDIIHEHQLYKDAANADTTKWDGLVGAVYHRFSKVK